jgi:hypothetical protein
MLNFTKLSTKNPRKYFFRTPSDDLPSKKMPCLFDQTVLTIEDSQTPIIHWDQGITSLKYLYPRKKIDLLLHSPKSISSHKNASLNNETYTIGDSWKIKGLHNYLNPRKPISKSFNYEENLGIPKILLNPKNFR